MRIKDKNLAQEIIKMAKIDQKLRKDYLNGQSVLRKIKEIDRLHLKKMKKIVKKFGWPTISLVGKKASHLAWLLIQHADFDVSFQEYCLRLMGKAASKGDVNKSNIAFLTDRILVNRGKPQIYGTQFYKDKKGNLSFRPIENIQSLNKRRRKMGMGAFEIYKKRMTNKK